MDSIPAAQTPKGTHASTQTQPVNLPNLPRTAQDSLELAPMTPEDYTKMQIAVRHHALQSLQKHILAKLCDIFERHAERTPPESAKVWLNFYACLKAADLITSLGASE